MTYDIALYGHLVFDTIVDGCKINSELGGIGNVWKSLKSFDADLSVYACPTVIGESTITIDRKNSKRTSESYLNMNTVEFTVERAKINHIAYINELMNTSFMPQLTGTIFADICTGKPLDVRTQAYVDYLFVSEEDLHLVNTKSFKGKLVVHSPRRSCVGEHSYETPPENYVENANVLGAGDHFAACFMYAKLNDRTDEDSLVLSHTLTTKWLKEKNET